MIEFGAYYNFAAEEVECIESATKSGKDFPYRLTVHTKSGRAFSVSYKEAKSRDAARTEMVRRIDSQKRAENEKLVSTLYLLRNDVERIDKR